MGQRIEPSPAHERLLEAARRIAEERGDESVDAVHVALAMASDAESEMTFILQRKMGVDVAELARRLRWRLEKPKPGAGEHGVNHLDGTVEIRNNDPVETISTWTPDAE